MSCIGVSSFAIASFPQILTSMSSVVGEDSCTLNHGGELKVQQELVGPHPCPSHRGSSIPQGITVRIENTKCLIPLNYACLTEVVLAHKWGNSTSTGAPSDTGAYCTKVFIDPFIKATDKAPDVLAGRTIRHTYSVNIVSVNCWPTTTKCIWGAYLVADDPPTHLIILLTASGVSETLTASPSRSSPTHSEWGGDLLPHRGTLLWRIRHVEVDYTFPASWPTT